MKSKGFSKGASGSMQKSFVNAKEYYDDVDYEFPRRNSSPIDAKDRRRSLQNNQAAQQALKNQAICRTRPTNNQLLYKAYFRWQHYNFKIRNNNSLLSETDACPSVTAAFLQVLQIMHTAELLRTGQQRNILQVLSTNTRRTKVVELSSGTHRVPDELKKHYLSDGDSGQYSTNLDRNRYGNDDNYLFTVIRYDLEFLGMCPCLVDVEIIDAKNNNQSVIVSAGSEACTCQKEGAGHGGTLSLSQVEEPTISNGLMRNRSPARQQTSNQPSKCDSPKRSASGVSQLFDALVMAATGGPEGAAVENAGGEPPVTSPYPNTHIFHSLPQRQRSRLWSALSYGDVDSLQNALEAFRAEEEIASQPFQLSDALGADSSLRHRKRKPPRHSSSLLGRTTMDSTGLLGISALAKSSLNEKSDENIKFNDSAVVMPTSTVESGEDDNEAIKPEDDDTEPELVSAGRMRHVPRQSSAVNLGTRVQQNANAYAELKRVAAEMESLKAENKRLENQLKYAAKNDASASLKKELEAERAKVKQLEGELAHSKTELQQASSAKKQAEERSAALTLEVASCRQQIQILISKLCSTPSVPPPPYSAPALSLPSVQGLCKHVDGFDVQERRQDGPALSMPWLSQAPLLHQVLSGHDTSLLSSSFGVPSNGGGRLGSSLSNPLAALLSQSGPSTTALSNDSTAADLATLLWTVGSQPLGSAYVKKPDTPTIPNGSSTPVVGPSSPKNRGPLSPTHKQEVKAEFGSQGTLSTKRSLEDSDNSEVEKPTVKKHCADLASSLPDVPELVNTDIQQQGVKVEY